MGRNRLLIYLSLIAVPLVCAPAAVWGFSTMSTEVQHGSSIIVALTFLLGALCSIATICCPFYFVALLLGYDFDAEKFPRSTAPQSEKTPKPAAKSVDEKAAPSSPTKEKNNAESVPVDVPPTAVAVYRAKLGDLIKIRADYHSQMGSAEACRILLIAVAAILSLMFFFIHPCIGVLAILILGGLCWGGFVLIDQQIVRKPVKGYCPYCKKYVPSDLSWVCLICELSHHKDNKFSFLNRCRQCDSVPTAYQCHHEDCEELIYLDDRYSKENIAYGVGRMNPKMSKRREREELMAQIRDENEILGMRLDRVVMLQQLDKLLKQAEKSTELPPKVVAKKTPKERINEEWNKYHEMIHELQSRVDKLRADAQQLHAGNPEGLKAANRRIDDFYAQTLQKFENGEL